MDFMSKVAPDLRQGLAGLPPLYLPQGLDTARAQPLSPFEKLASIRITEQFIDDADGNNMLVKIYEPAQRGKDALPALLWIHGGGYVLGHPSGEDGMCQSFVQAANCVVISPDYRLAPEHPFPAPIEDCYAALKWVANNKDSLNIDTTRIAIGGGSAGGGLTAALALLNRDRGGPDICFQMPLYPMIDDRNVTSSSYEITHPAVWNRENNLAAWKMYLGEHAASDDISPYAAPARATDLSGLPPAYTCVGQLDPFRDETIEYAARLAQAGVDVELHVVPGGYHAFEHVVPEAEISQRLKKGYVDALTRYFSR